MAKPTGYEIPCSQEELEELAAKIRRQSPTPISAHTAYILAVRLVGQT